MRIALLARADSVHTMRWANALTNRGHDVHLLSAHDRRSSLSSAVYLHRLPIRPWLGYFLNAVPLRACLKRIRPDVLHAHYASGYGTLLRLSGYRPQVLSVWGTDVFDFPAKWPWKRRLLVANLRSADWVCSTSRVMADHTRGLCGGIRRLTVTPFGVDVRKFAPRPEARDERFFTIGTVKILHSKYGIDTLIQGFARCRQLLQAETPGMANRLRLRIVGSGPHRDEYQRLITRLGLSNVANLVGETSHREVPNQLNRLHVYVGVSRCNESFGVAAVEASSCGLPVVVSNVGGLPEVVIDGETGLVIPKENPGALAHALLRLIRDPGLRARLGSAGRRHVIDQYDWEENVARMERIYQELTGLGKAAA